MVILLSFSVKGCRITVDFSFVLVLSFAAMLEAEDLFYLLLFSGIHELSHMTALILLGGRPQSLKFSFYGLALKYEQTLSRVREFFVIFAGPAANLILFAFLHDDINLILFCLNILPIYPLDGGRIVELFSYRISQNISKIFLLLIVILSAIMIFKYKNFSLLLTAVYLIAYTFLR